MKLRLHANKIYSADLEGNDHPVAEFTDELIPVAKKRIILRHNYGFDMLNAYEAHRDNMHILGVVELMQSLEEIYTGYRTEEFAAKRKLYGCET